MRPNDSNQVIAILLADIHLTLTPPVARAKEKDWLDVQAGYLEQVKEVAGHHPIVCAGDIFDSWKCSPELINFALEHLPEMYAIPGQHDLPLHNLEDIKRSAFWTLVKAGKVKYLRLNKPVGIGGLVLHGVPYGCDIPEVEGRERDTDFHLVVVHKYIWTGTHSYPGAPKDSEIRSLAKVLRGYGAAVFGDNHKGFLSSAGGFDVLNCGTLMRRKTDEADYKPQVGLLHSDGEIGVHFLDTSEDKLEVTEAVKQKEVDSDLEQFLRDLGRLRQSKLDFVEAMQAVMEQRGTRAEVRKLIQSAMEGKGNESGRASVED